MSDFCKQCSIDMFGFDAEDFAGLCSPDGLIQVLCEGCGGQVLVTHLGESVEFNPLSGKWKIKPTKVREEDMGFFEAKIENELKYLPVTRIIDTFNCGIMSKIIQNWQMANGVVNPTIEIHSIGQVYDLSDPNTRYRCSVDLKDSKATYTTTWKDDKPQSREEITKEISAKLYFEQEAKTKKVIHKTRFSFNYMVKDVEFIIELDYFGNRDEFLIEVEHDDMAMLELFHANIPFFCGENVTMDHRYKNKHIAAHGFPK